MRSIVIVLAALCLSLNTFSQDSIRTLQIGDTVPDLLFTHVLNAPQDSLRLSALGDKIVLLNCWATWCGSCVTAFPKLDSLQQKFEGQLKIILVNILPTTGEKISTVEGFVSRFSQRQPNPLKLPVALETTDRLRQLFPHLFIPHCIWIGKNKRVIAITSDESLTPETIGQAILCDKPMVALKHDVY